MIIDEKKIQEIVEKEIKQQVEHKLKQIGRDTLKSLYKDVVRDQVREFLMEQELNLSKEIREVIMFDKDEWKKEVTNTVSEQLVGTMVGALKDSGNCY